MVAVSVKIVNASRRQAVISIIYNAVYLSVAFVIDSFFKRFFVAIILPHIHSTVFVGILGVENEHAFLEFGNGFEKSIRS